MIIKSNLAAINAYNKLKVNSKEQTKILGKLSSGKRINQAADDAAGMAIAQKMKAQTRGLRMAKYNIQNGISLVQTAESGLGEIQSQVHRMRELAVQAGNGTLTENDRKEVQKEIEQLKAGIDDIAHGTDFNGIKPLSPKFKVNSQPSNSGTTPKLDIVFHIDYSASMTDGDITAVKEGTKSFVEELGQSTDAQVAVVNMTNDGRISIKDTYSSFESDTDKIKSNIDNTSKVDSWTRPYEQIDRAYPDGDIGKRLGYREGAHKAFVLFTDAYDEAAKYESGYFSSEETAKNTLEGTNIKNGFDSDDIQTYVFGMAGTISEGDFDEIVDFTGGKYYSPSSSDDITDKLNQLVDDLKTNVDKVEGDNSQKLEPSTLRLQVGPNLGDELRIELTDARTTNLGIDDIKVDPIEEAMKAIEKLDKANSQVSKERGKFGSYENRLNHIYNNVANSESNLTSANSKIEDADMAKQVMKMTKGQILKQAGEAILSQASSMTQGVLSLLPSDMK